MKAVLGVPEDYLLSAIEVIEAGLRHAELTHPEQWKFVDKQLSNWCAEYRVYLEEQAE